MKLIRYIIRDVQARQNLDIYITVLMSLVVAVLGLLQVADQAIISSAVLATLALVSVSLLVNRRENDEIRQALARMKGLQSRIDVLVSSMGIKVDFIPIQKDMHRIMHPKVTELISKASREVLVLDYNPLEETESKVRYSEEHKVGRERREYYATTIEKVLKSKPGTFRYRRILQVPEGRRVSDVLADDPVFREHCEALVKIGERQPEIASLKTCVPLYMGTYMLIDGRHLLFDVTFLDPERRYHSEEGGAFFFEDPTGKLVDSFLKFFERADAHATLVRSTDLRC